MISIQGYYNPIAAFMAYILIFTAIIGLLSFYAYVKTSSTKYVKTYWKKHPTERNLLDNGFDD